MARGTTGDSGEPEPADREAAAQVWEGLEEESVEEVAAPKLGPAWLTAGGCSVLVPPGQPAALIHFVGAAVAGAAPAMFYRSFLERIVEETSAAVVATPYEVGSDLEEAAEQASDRLDSALLELVGRKGVGLTGLPLYCVGHSLGGALALLLAERRPSAGNILMGFNQRPVSDLIPAQLPTPPPWPIAPMVELMRSGAARLLSERRLADALDAAVGSLGLRPAFHAGAAGADPADLARLLSQVRLSFGDFVAGRRVFRPSRAELARRLLKAGALAPRTLLVEFSDDVLDETQWFLSTFGCQELPPPVEDDPYHIALDEAMEQAMEEAFLEAYGETWDQEIVDDEGWDEREWDYLADGSSEGEAASDGSVASEPKGSATQEQPGAVVEKIRLAGGHFMPLDLTGVFGGDESSIDSLARQVGRFIRGEKGCRWFPGMLSGARFALREKLLRCAAGLNRGFGLVLDHRRGEVMDCVSQLEALFPVHSKRHGEGPRISDTAIGRWSLLWADAAGLPLLTSVPLVECGEVSQEVFMQVNLPTKPAKVVYSVEITPKGAGLLASLPLIRDTSSARVTIEASVAPISDTKVSVSFVSGTIQPFAQRWPALPLPVFQSALSAITLLTTFDDGDLRVERSLDGDLFVWLRE